MAAYVAPKYWTIRFESCGGSSGPVWISAIWPPGLTKTVTGMPTPPNARKNAPWASSAVCYVTPARRARSTD